MKNNLKKIISTIIIVAIIFNTFVSIIAFANSEISENDLNINSESILKKIDVNITIEDYMSMSFGERQQYVNEISQQIFPASDEIQYKSNDSYPTHQSITSQSIVAFMNDKGFFFSDPTENLVYAIVLMVYSAAPDKFGDESYKASYYDHFYVPSTGKGWGAYDRSAADACEEYYNKAVKSAKSKDMETALMHLGRALHYAQDVTVPHHTINYTTVAHSEFEKFCYNNIENYISDITTVSASQYSSQSELTCRNTVASLARVANLYYDYVKSTTDKTNWDLVAGRQTVIATKRTAVLIYKFALDAGLTIYKV